ncbi:MAG: FecR domain-containing protein [Acidobacteria bacterium]|nr:FecR domain-containing protein [Acidobacteriota bacterium]
MKRNLNLVVIVLGLLAFAATGHAGEYARIARLSLVEGHVSFMHPNEVDWAPASVNLALQPGDRIYTGSDGRAEIEFDEGSVLRMAEKTDVELVAMGEDRIRFRVLVGLCTLSARTDIPFEVNTPAATFNTRRDGVYRFDITEGGASDGIVRRGRMDVSGRDFSERLDTGELVHVEPGDQGTHLLSRYDGRDDWDEWTDRRSADLIAYESRRYLPDTVYYGVSDLDRYGRWVAVDTYGWGWVPYVGAGWSPYWDGRWYYRPYWGWTWISYEPWGWLPYHYGRWHFSLNLGWCWLPGPSFGFHFWSPGLVRFYHGPSWVSWVPLGPGDYYNVDYYWYRPSHRHYLNHMQLVQHRGPNDLANRHIPGAFRAAPTDDFVNGRVGRGAPSASVASIAQPWKEGRMVTGRLDVAPTSKSFLPVAGRQGVPSAGDGAAGARGARGARGDRAPAADPSNGLPLRGFQTPVNRLDLGRSEPGRTAAAPASAAEPNVNVIGDGGNETSRRNPVGGQGTRIWNRVDSPSRTETAPPVSEAASEIRTANPRSVGRSVPGNPGGRAYEAPAGNRETAAPSVIERRSGSDAGRRAEPGNRPESPAREGSQRRSLSSPQPASPAGQRYESRNSYSSSTDRFSERGEIRNPSSSMSMPRSYSVEPRSGIGFAASDPGRWQSYGRGGSSPSLPQRSWQSGRSPSGASGGPAVIHQSPSWGRATPPGAVRGGTRGAPPGGGAGILRGRRH